jgi:lipoyl(octanoyl) transferase
MAEPKLTVIELGLAPYAETLTLQRDVARRRISGEIADDVLLLVEHPPVVTLGRTTKNANLIASPALLASQGVELYDVERGGDITFHGPGQLVGYPIIDLKRHKKDLHWYLRQVEQALIDGIAAFGLAGSRVGGYTGVWVGNQAAESQVQSPQSRSRKIASIGVHARDWVTWHGFALNVNTDLRYFDLIVPCGITDVTMTSVARELNQGSIDMRAVIQAVTQAFSRTFALESRTIDAAELHAMLRAASAQAGVPAAHG